MSAPRGAIMGELAAAGQAVAGKGEMAGSNDGTLRELLSPFLRAKLAEARTAYGEAGAEYLALARQYLSDVRERAFAPTERSRHYQSEVNVVFDGAPVVGIERLYRRTILIEPTTSCAAHCRWCLRGQYQIQTMTRDQIERAARYMGSTGVRDDLSEVLITGGDPLVSLPLLRH